MNISKEQKDKVAGILQTVRDSCYEGEDGTWDCSTDEGKEGFLAMAEQLESLAEMFEIKLKEYQKAEDEE